MGRRGKEESGALDGLTIFVCVEDFTGGVGAEDGARIADSERGKGEYGSTSTLEREEGSIVDESPLVVNLPEILADSSYPERCSCSGDFWRALEEGRDNGAASTAGLGCLRKEKKEVLLVVAADWVVSFGKELNSLMGSSCCFALLGGTNPGSWYCLLPVGGTKPLVAFDIASGRMGN